MQSLLLRLDVSDDTNNRTLRLMNWITLAIVFVGIFHVAVTSMVARRMDVAVYGSIAVILAAVLNVVARRGNSQIASFFFISGLWILVTLPNILPGGNGIFGAAFTAYIIPILLGGLLLGGKVSYLFALLSVGVGAVFAYSDLMTPDFSVAYDVADILLKYSSEAIFFVIAATLLALAHRNTVNALKSAKASEQELLLRNAELERQIAERQRVEKALRASEGKSQAFQECLKALHEVSIRLSAVPTLDELHKQSIQFGLEELGFDRMAWFMIDPATKKVKGTYGTDPQGKLREEHGMLINFSISDWANFIEDFTDKGHVRYMRDTVLWDVDQKVGQGWNAVAAVLYGEHIFGWLVVDNLLRQANLENYQLEILRLYGLVLGQLVIQKQTQQMLVDKDTRLNLALEAANMRSWDWSVETDTFERDDLFQQAGFPVWATFENFLADVHPDDQSFVLDAAQKMIDNAGIFEAEYRTTDVNGEIHWLYSLGQTYRDANGDIAGVAGVVQDITPRKRIEESLKLADQQAMELALEKERVTALSEFIHTISHDFKTPLAIINNSLYLLERIDDPKKHKEKLALIKTQTLLLDKQIQDILTISRLQYTQVVARHAVNMNLLVSKLDELFHASLEKKNLTMELALQPALPNILANADELDRVFVNLLENAINYTPAGGTISLSTRSTHDSVEFSIADTGIGMTPEDQQKVFNNFYRGENARMINSKGTGLGLAIVHKIITIHEGKIKIESELNKGTCFRLYFPIYQQPK